MATPPTFTAGAVLTAAQMNAVGSWLVKQQTVGTSVTSISITNCFSSDYDNYRVYVYFNTASGATDCQIKFAAGNTYSFVYKYVFFGTATETISTLTAQAAGRIGTSQSGATFVLDIFKPNLATPTWVQSQFVGNSYSGEAYTYDSNSAAHTGFTLDGFTVTGGEIRVYGLRN